VLIKALLITQLFKKISNEDSDLWSDGGVGDRLEAAIQSLFDSPDDTVVLAKAGLEPKAHGISSLRGFVSGVKKGGKKGGKEAHRRAALVRTVLFACYRRQASDEAAAAFVDATAAQRLDTLQAWLEEVGVNATKAVEEAGIPKKALWMRISSLCGFVKGGKETHRRAALVRTGNGRLLPRALRSTTQPQLRGWESCGNG
jgi:hypothetical protein